MRCIVTGGAGFIGSHVVDAFIAEGHSVAVIDNLSTGKRANLNPAARFYEADIRDADALAEIFTTEKPEAVSHQAALADLRASLGDPVGFTQVNVIGALNLLEASRAVGTVRKFVFASSGGAAYGNPAELPATESCPARPLDPYGVSKVACELYLYTYKHNYQLDYCALRYANVYGPRQDPFGEAGVVAIFGGAMLDGRPVTIYGDGLQTRDFTYVADVAQANLLALSYGSGIYNIGTGRPTDIQTLFHELAGITGYAAAPAHAPGKAGEARRNYLDAYKARRELGWQPAVELCDGLARTVEAFRGN